MVKDSAQDKSHLVLVNAVVFKDDKVLVSRRSWDELHEPGKWTIPGGKVERTKGDVFNILEKTLKREVKEETGVEIHDDVKLIMNNTFIRSTGQHVIALVFKCEYKSGAPTPLDDTIECKWASLHEVKSMDFAPNVKKYLLKAFETREKTTQ